jgi:hypothetical protein
MDTRNLAGYWAEKDWNICDGCRGLHFTAADMLYQPHKWRALLSLFSILQTFNLGNIHKSS